MYENENAAACTQLTTENRLISRNVHKCQFHMKSDVSTEKLEKKRVFDWSRRQV